MATVDFHAAAFAEADAARVWYENRRPLLGEGFSVAVEEAVAAVSDGPMAWPADDTGARRYPLTRFPYSLIYVVLSAESIVVLAVAHQRRKPGYWRDRLRPGSQ